MLVRRQERVDLNREERANFSEIEEILYQIHDNSITGGDLNRLTSTLIDNLSELLSEYCD